MTTTTTAPADTTEIPLPGRAEAHHAGVALLDAYLAALRGHGYQKRAIDTWIGPGGNHYIRHAYCNGEWTLTCGNRGEGSLEVRYSVRATMPSVEQLLSATLPPPF